jgi:hypothetical protein
MERFPVDDEPHDGIAFGFAGWMNLFLSCCCSSPLSPAVWKIDDEDFVVWIFVAETRAKATDN